MKNAISLIAVLLLLGVVQSNDGARLYATRCASCHGSIGQGSGVAPSLLGIPAVDVHLMLDTGRMPAGAPYVNEVHRMPAFTDEQIDAIVAYVTGFSPGTDTSLPIVLAGNVAHGRELFAENCQACHGALGNGASVGFADVAPALSGATIFQVAEAIRAGPGIMPRFGPNVLSDQDVSDIAHFVNYVQTQPPTAQSIDAGGVSLAHTGPVAEGFVAWFFGLGALLLFIRFIGTAGEEPPPR